MSKTTNLQCTNDRQDVKNDKDDEHNIKNDNGDEHDVKNDNVPTTNATSKMITMNTT